jgi:F-type H+-transporting ATPase subunit b
MGETLSQLARLFIQTIPTVIFVFVLYVILSRFFFGPLTAVLKRREEETQGAIARAHEQAAAAEEKARQYEAAFQAARQDTYRLREAAGRSILADRQATLKRAHQESEVLLGEAQVSLAAEVAQHKKELENTCQSLGQEIAETILGGAAGDGAGRIQP